MATSAEIKSYIENLTATISDEEERAKAIYDAAKANGVSSADIDSAMGWGSGTTSNYISTNMSGYNDLGGTAISTPTTATAYPYNPYDNTVPQNSDNSCPDGYDFTPWGCVPSNPVVQPEAAPVVGQPQQAVTPVVGQPQQAVTPVVGQPQQAVTPVVGEPSQYTRDPNGNIYRFNFSTRQKELVHGPSLANTNQSAADYNGIGSNPKPTTWAPEAPLTDDVPGASYREYLRRVTQTPGAAIPQEAWQTYSTQTIGSDELLTDKAQVTGNKLDGNFVGYSDRELTPEEIRRYIVGATANVANESDRERIIYEQARSLGVSGNQIDGAMGWLPGSTDNVTQKNGWTTLESGIVGVSSAGGYEAQIAQAAQMRGVRPGQVTQEMLVDPNINVNLREGSIADFEKEDLDRRATIQYQLENLLDFPPGEIPAWAKGAIDTMNSELAARGVGRSTIARDSLYNAIVQSALPIAQNDANAYKEAWIVNMELDTKVAIANAATLANVSIKDADLYQQGQIANARAFLEMDWKNMDMEQRTQEVNLQARQQTLLSNQAAVNAARKFGAEQEQDIIKFNQTMAATIKMDNASRKDSIDQFNETQDFSRQQFNIAMALEIEKANTEWRRTVNTQNTAGINAINQANAMNSFDLSTKALDYLWNEYRDVAEWAHEGAQNDKEVATKLAIAGMDNQTKLQAASITAKGAIDAARLGAESRENIAATQASTSRYNTDAQSDASATNLLYSVGGKIGGLAIDMFTETTYVDSFGNAITTTPWSDMVDSISSWF